NQEAPTAKEAKYKATNAAKTLRVFTVLLVVFNIGYLLGIAYRDEPATGRIVVNSAVCAASTTFLLLCMILEKLIRVLNEKTQSAMRPAISEYQRLKREREEDEVLKPFLMTDKDCSH